MSDEEMVSDEVKGAWAAWLGAFGKCWCGEKQGLDMSWVDEHMKCAPPEPSTGASDGLTDNEKQRIEDLSKSLEKKLPWTAPEALAEKISGYLQTAFWIGKRSMRPAVVGWKGDPGGSDESLVSFGQGDQVHFGNTTHFLEREIADLRTLVGFADHYFAMATLDGAGQEDLFRAYCKMSDAAKAYKTERSKYRRSPPASEEPKIAETPYRPCIVHGVYDPILKQCPGCLADGIVDRSNEAPFQTILSGRGGGKTLNMLVAAFDYACRGDVVTIARPSPLEDITIGPTSKLRDIKPIPMLIWCPKCSSRHIDEGEFATKPHHTHSCQSCGLTWRPAIGPTVGVAFLPGFKNVEKIVVVPAPGDRCGGTGQLSDGKCPGCRACS